MSKQFHFKTIQFSVSNTSLSKPVPFQTNQFSIKKKTVQFQTIQPSI